MFRFISHLVPMRLASSFFTASCLALSAVFLAGCAVGSDFVAPAAPDITAYDSGATPDVTPDRAQLVLSGQDIPAQWWDLFHSDNLNRLVTQAIKDNPDLASAEASLRVAEDELAAEKTTLFPTISGSLASQRQKVAAVSNNGVSSIYTLHNASVGVSYSLDLWGGKRRTIEQLQAQAEAARFQKEAAYLALTSNVVTAAIQEASLREQITAMREIISNQEKTLKVLEARFEAGAVDKSAILEQQAVLAAAKTNLPPLEHQRVVTRHALTALVGQLPPSAPKETFTLAEMILPPQIPLSLPSRLVEQRPDIREAQENLHAASAAIGIAEAARLPNIVLSADIGSMATIFTKLLSPGGGFWSLGGSATETLFDAGALSDKEDAARDAYAVAEAQYRKAVVAAFQNVADTLHALQSDAESLNAKRDAEKASADSLALTEARFAAGAIGVVELLNAQQSEQQAKIALVQAKAQRYADTAALFAALGGGWWNRDAEAKPPAPETSAPKL